MITVDKHDYQWRPGLTVDALLEALKKNDKFREAIHTNGTFIVINNEIITPDQYKQTRIQEDDMIHFLSAMAGG